MKKQATKKPFFAKFLTSQVDEKLVKAGMTYKFPSDADETKGTFMAP